MAHFDLVPELMPAADGAKVIYVEVEDMKNAGKFVINYEDHTIGNLVRMQLHRDPDVLFAGYRNPHPLYPKVEVKIQTTDAINPKTAFRIAIEDLMDHLTNIEEEFQKQLNQKTG